MRLFLLILASLFIADTSSRVSTAAALLEKKKKRMLVQKLPEPQTSGGMALTEALAARRSTRSYKQDQPLTVNEISQLLWAAQGITKKGGKRTSPSAGALYPLEVYLLTDNGHYHYDPNGHKLETYGNTDLRNSLYWVSLRQNPVKDAPACFVFTAVYERTAVKYGSTRSERYVAMEAGHAVQNLLLQATALGLGGVPIGAFNDGQVADVLGIPDDHEPIYVVPVGRPG